MSTPVVPHVDISYVSVVGAVHTNHTSFVIAVLLKKSHAVLAWPCVPVVALVLLNANDPAPAMAVGAVQESVPCAAATNARPPRHEEVRRIRVSRFMVVCGVSVGIEGEDGRSWPPSMESRGRL